MYNYSNNSSLRHLDDSYQNNIAYAVCFIMLSLSATFLNGIILAVIRTNSYFRTNSYKILALLNCSHLLFGILSSPLTAATLISNYVMHGHILFCKTMTPVVVAISINMLAFYAFERCIQIITDSNYQMEQKTLNVVIALAYLVPLITYLLRLLKDKDVTFLVIIDIEIGLMGIIMVLILGGVITSLNHYTKRTRNTLHSDFVTNTRDARTVVIVTVFFLILNLPFIIKISHDSSTDQNHFIVLLCGASSVVTPFIFISRLVFLRKCVVRLCTLKRGNAIEPE